MLAKHKLITTIIDTGIVAGVRVDSIERSINTAKAILDGGIPTVEITFTVPHAHSAIEKLSSLSCILGAGTVLDSETARIAILSGASYIVSPNFDRETALLCNRYAVPYMAGCSTPTEIVEAMQYGVEIVKLFPAGIFPPTIIKSLRAPLPQANIMPTGGISLENVEGWIRAGAVALCVGGDLVAGAKTDNFNDVTNKAIAYREKVAHTRRG